MPFIPKPPFTNKGQAVLMVLVILPLFILGITKMQKFYRFVERKIALQTGTDLALLTFTQTLTDGFNEISDLNQKIRHCHMLLKLAQTGEILTGHPGFVLSEKVLKKMIQLMAKKQDLIGMLYPKLAMIQALRIAQKNQTPHLVISPLIFHYPLIRTRMGTLAGPLELKPWESTEFIFLAKAYQYRGAYTAHAQMKLKGDSIDEATWKNVFTE